MHRRLRKAQGPFRPKPRRSILDELVMTVLSQATSDVNSGRAFEELKRRFPTWEQVARTPASAIADAIRRGGIADVKARRIKAILDSILDRQGRLDLGHLHDRTTEEIYDYLCSLPGVGRKTAACVLVFSMGRPAFPVDTHVLRVAARLGWIEERTPALRAHSLLEPTVPEEIRYELHMQLITHGREICKARMPVCSECALLDLCEAGPRLLGEGAAR